MGSCLDSGANLSNRPSEDGRRADCSPAPPTMQVLRDICSGSITHYPLGGHTLIDELKEIPICGKTWWEDGEQYECLMDKGHKELKHGMRGMVRVIS